MARILGPECPKCECPDTEVIGSRLVFGVRRERCACAFCGEVFTPDGLAPAGAARGESADAAAPAEPEPETAATSASGRVTYNANPVRCSCPKCKARNPPITSTQKKSGHTVRHHRCACGERFQSIESDA